MGKVSIESVAAIKRSSSSVAYHLYHSIYSKAGSNDLICLFEGRDAPYYNIRIKQYTDKVIHPIQCGNKDNVIKLHDKLSREKNKKGIKRLYFVDRDFDPLIKHPEIFETCRYSIENYYCEPSVFQEILKCEYGLSIASDEYNILSSLYNKLFSIYCQKILYFNAWYRSLKILKKTKNLESVGFSLDNKLPKAFINVDLHSVIGDYTIEDLKKTFPDAISFDEKDVQSSLKVLSNEPHVSLRGKFLLYFLYKFLSCLNDNCKKEKTYISKNVKFEVQYREAITKLSVYAVTPASLIDYLQRNLN